MFATPTVAHYPKLPKSASVGTHSRPDEFSFLRKTLPQALLEAMKKVIPTASVNPLGPESHRTSFIDTCSWEIAGEHEWIRTADLLVPNQMSGFSTSFYS